MANARVGRTTPSHGVLRVSQNPAFKAQLQATRDEIQLSDDLPVWITARMDKEDSGLHLSIGSRSGQSTASLDLPLNAAVREALQAVLDEHTPALRDEMRDHLALNLIGAMATPPEAHPNPEPA